MGKGAHGGPGSFGLVEGLSADRDDTLPLSLVCSTRGYCSRFRRHPPETPVWKLEAEISSHCLRAHAWHMKRKAELEEATWPRW